MTKLRLALSQYPITAPTSLEAFAAKLDGIVAEARAAGAEFVVLPEYASMETAAAFPGTGNASSELHSVCAAGPALLEIFCATAQRHAVWLLPGTLPWQSGARIVNRAPLIAPDGRLAVQEKTTMTRFEAEQWGVAPGAPHGVFATDWGTVGIAICYDVEFPSLVRAQVIAGAWLILAPSCTDSLHGFNRVRLSARARAVENQIYTAMVPLVGTAAWAGSIDTNIGHTALFTPCDDGFPDDGVAAAGPLNEPGLIFADVDFAAIDIVRANGNVLNHRDWVQKIPPCPIVELI